MKTKLPDGVIIEEVEPRSEPGPPTDAGRRCSHHAISASRARLSEIIKMRRELDSPQRVGQSLWLQ